MKVPRTNIGITIEVVALFSSTSHGKSVSFLVDIEFVAVVEITVDIIEIGFDFGLSRLASCSEDGAVFFSFFFLVVRRFENLTFR